MTAKRTNPIISVIIPTYNRAELLRYTLHSLCCQSLDRQKFEVIVADDGSYDKTIDVINYYRTRLNLKYSFQEDKGYRVASARNLGIRLAKGDMIAFVDSGVILAERCLEEHVRGHLSNVKPVAIIGYVFGFEQENNKQNELQALIQWKKPQVTIDACRLTGQFLDLREDCYIKYKDHISDLPAPWAFFWTCNVSVTAESLHSSGLFDENFDGYWGVEDHELGFRLHQSNVKFILNREASAIHYPHAKDRDERIQQELRNKRYFHEKYNCDATRMFLDADFSTINTRILEFDTYVEKRETLS